jgi:hypothetical protein
MSKADLDKQIRKLLLQQQIERGLEAWQELQFRINARLNCCETDRKKVTVDGNEIEVELDERIPRVRPVNANPLPVLKMSRAPEDSLMRELELAYRYLPRSGMPSFWAGRFIRTINMDGSFNFGAIAEAKQVVETFGGDTWSASVWKCRKCGTHWPDPELNDCKHEWGDYCTKVPASIENWETYIREPLTTHFQNVVSWFKTAIKRGRGPEAKTIKIKEMISSGKYFLPNGEIDKVAIVEVLSPGAARNKRKTIDVSVVDEAIKYYFK